MRASLWFLLLAACSPYKPDLPAQPFLCGSTAPQCPEGFACQAVGTQMVCVDTTGTAPDGGSGGGDGGFPCQDDHMIEPNDTLAQAFQTPVASQLMTIKFAMLAICPASDKDTYKVDITTNLQNLEAIVEYDADGSPLQVSILNAGGTPIANSTPVTGMDNMVHAMAANLPPGTFYAQVFSGSGENNYKLTLNVTGP